MSEPIKLLTTRADADVAADVKRGVAELLSQVAALMDSAQDAGLTVNFTMGKDWRGKSVIAALTVARVF